MLRGLEPYTPKQGLRCEDLGAGGFGSMVQGLGFRLKCSCCVPSTSNGSSNKS